ncbi:CHASE domain-containing protein [Tritonibacter horizontis]|uniref:histidine kinase n=1 Tax=Tritonibacter horizontis TaxID=1768241 RepID=A0A132BZL1_9RHOB|nr:CHASE domain-containing protein [Tritonibacter horizontis]KUP93492.1 phytochrome-like protein cph1 [Tritonibacter horizontis]
MPSPSGQHGKITTLHIVIVALSLTMTLGAWLYSKHQLDEQIENRFVADKNRTIGLIADRMSRYEDALWSGVAHVAARQEDTTLEDWRLFSDTLNLEEKYPGVNGIGVIHYVEREDLPEFMALRAAEPREFSIFPDHEHPFLLPITFIEPVSMNGAAVGLDVAHETNRRTALLASRDTGQARITGPIVLVQDSGRTAGFLFYAPFYTGSEPTTLEDRRAQFAGVVYAPFIVRRLVEGLLAKDLRNVHFSIRDEAEVIYNEHNPDDALYDADPMFQETVELDMYGRVWTVDIRTNLAFRAANGSEQPTLILAGGLVIETLVILMLAMLAKSTRFAHDYAHRLTRELREKTEKLEHANAEIEQFVYIASHDLKTPVRGIGFLTDVIEEDLTELIGPLDKHSGLKSQFDMIRQRLNRMNDLTQGIMEYSRVGHLGSVTQTQVPLEALLKDCVSDFNLDPAQVQLTSDVDAITCDAQSFRRVLENLLSNAIRYHPDPDAAQVTVTIHDELDQLRVSVRDNGKGISPEHHEKIFEVFQTLRRSTDPESTGIGLSIVRRAVQRHGFEIKVISSEGNGTEFVFQWPKEHGQSEHQTEKAA